MDVSWTEHLSRVRRGPQPGVPQPAHSLPAQSPVVWALVSFDGKGDGEEGIGTGASCLRSLRAADPFPPLVSISPSVQWELPLSALIGSYNSNSQSPGSAEVGLK